jgi:hypothetical protein
VFSVRSGRCASADRWVLHGGPAHARRSSAASQRPVSGGRERAGTDKRATTIARRRSLGSWRNPPSRPTDVDVDVDRSLSSPVMMMPCPRGPWESERARQPSGGGDAAYQSRAMHRVACRASARLPCPAMDILACPSVQYLTRVSAWFSALSCRRDLKAPLVVTMRLRAKAG